MGGVWGGGGMGGVWLRQFDGDVAAVAAAVAAAAMGGHSVSPGAACWSEVTQLVAR